MIAINNTRLLVAGAFSGLMFAPVFFLPVLCLLGFLIYAVYQAKTSLVALLYGFWFGLGHFVTSMYWISIGVAVYDEMFWAIPFALLGLPSVLACFIALTSFVSWFCRNKQSYYLLFCFIWVCFEWLRSWIFTGLPWNLLGYSLVWCDSISQSVNIISIYGLSFLCIYLGGVAFFYLRKDKIELKVNLLTGIIVVLALIIYGVVRLHQNPTQWTEIKVRIVQPCIAQTDKWDVTEFVSNLNKHISLSVDSKSKPDLIIWPEAAITVPYDMIREYLTPVTDSGAFLLTGGVSLISNESEEKKLYTSLYAIDSSARQIAIYHKSHLVPFGEYMPLRQILPMKKITPGFIDYTAGERQTVTIEPFNLKINPLICYESIFPNEAKISNELADVIINITNDAWYGKSSGPYQHFYISKIRAIENGLPMLRVANNGISAVIDPLGRVLAKLPLNITGILDSKIPAKFINITFYSQYGDITFFNMLIFIIFLHTLVKILLAKSEK